MEKLTKMQKAFEKLRAFPNLFKKEGYALLSRNLSICIGDCSRLVDEKFREKEQESTKVLKEYKSYINKTNKKTAAQSSKIRSLSSQLGHAKKKLKFWNNFSVVDEQTRYREAVIALEEKLEASREVVSILKSTVSQLRDRDQKQSDEVLAQHNKIHSLETTIEILTDSTSRLEAASKASEIAITNQANAIRVLTDVMIKEVSVDGV